MKHLLLISNISSKNVQLLKYAAQFCKYYTCKLHILHISKYKDPVLVSSPQYYEHNNVSFNQTENQLLTEKVSTIVNKILDREFIQVEIKKGNQEQVLSSFISDHFIDMVMIGNHDLESESDFSNYKNFLINVINTPIAVIPKYETFEPLKKFNFLTTHTDDNLDHIEQLVELFPAAEINLLHFKNDKKELGIKEQKWVKLVKSQVVNKLNYQLINEDIQKYIRLENASIFQLYNAFVFTTHKRKFWSRLLDPNTTLSYLAGLDIPSIVFKI